MSKHGDRLRVGVIAVAVLLFGSIPLMLGFSIAEEMGYPPYYGLSVILSPLLVYALGFGVEKTYHIIMRSKANE